MRVTFLQTQRYRFFTLFTAPFARIFSREMKVQRVKILGIIKQPIPDLIFNHRIYLD